MSDAEIKQQMDDVRIQMGVTEPLSLKIKYVALWLAILAALAWWGLGGWR